MLHVNADVLGKLEGKLVLHDCSYIYCKTLKYGNLAAVIVEAFLAFTCNSLDLEKDNVVAYLTEQCGSSLVQTEEQPWGIIDNTDGDAEGTDPTLTKQNLRK